MLNQIFMLFDKKNYLNFGAEQLAGVLLPNMQILVYKAMQ